MQRTSLAFLLSAVLAATMSFWQGVDLPGSTLTLVAIDRRYFRPLEVDHLEGDAGKARDRLGWQPTTAQPWIADSPIPPQPITAAGRPARACAVLSTAPTPVTTAQPTIAATSNGTSSASAAAAPT